MAPYRFSRLSFCLGLLLGSGSLGLLALPAPLHGQPSALAESEAFFKSGKVLQIAIELDKKELDSLRREPRKYARATLKEGANVYKDIGVHLKGAAGSFRGIDDKPNLTLNMDKFAAGPQRFYGMDKFHLANSLQDPSYISELICGELFRAVDVPASRVAHAVVTINGRKCGLFYVKEGYDKYFIRHHFKTSRGNFYDGGFLRDLDQPLQLLKGTDDVKNHADLKAVVAAARDGNPQQRWQKLEKLLDMDRFISYMAMEVVTWDWDGYPMNRNNYRLHHDPERDKLTFIPSGMDQMFGDPNGTIFPGFQGFVARAVLETPEGRKRYIARMDEIATKIYQPDVLLKRLDELQARLQPVLTEINAGLGRDYPNQINRLRHAIPQRAKSIQAQLKTVKK